MTDTLWAVAGVIFAVACVASLAWDFYQKRQYEAWKRQQTVVQTPHGEAIILPEHAEDGITADTPLYNPPPVDAPKKWEKPPGEGFQWPAWLRRETGERVFVAEIGGWPKVWKLRDGPPAVYVLKARFSSPKGLKEAQTLAIGGAVVLALWLNSAITPPGATGGPFVVAALISVFFGGMLYVVLRFVLRLLNPFLGPSLHMTLTGAALEWKGYRRTWWGHTIKEKIFPNEARGEVRVVSHGQAPAELRKAQERVRKGKKEPRMYYQQASEVIIDVGPQGNSQLKVAEIANDEHGEKGGKIAGAIIAATKAAQGMGAPPAAVEPVKKKGLFG